MPPDDTKRRPDRKAGSRLLMFQGAVIAALLGATVAMALPRVGGERLHPSKIRRAALALAGVTP